VANEPSEIQASPAEIVRELSPLPDGSHVHGVTFDGSAVWIATGDTIQSVDPITGKLGRSLKVPATAGTAFDGRHFFQIAAGEIQKIDSTTGEIVTTLPAPGGGDAAGLTWAEGALWVGQFRGRKILKIDPTTGEILRTLESTRFVTGVTFVQGDLWHGTLENDASELRRVASDSGEVLERLTMPEGKTASGLESDGADLLYVGGANRSGKVYVVRRPAKRAIRQ